MTTELKNQMRNFDGNAGDRLDPVAKLCRRHFLRVELCPCMGVGDEDSCIQCKHDMDAIEAAWNATNEKSES